MSRIGKQPIEIIKGTEVALDGRHLTVKGPKGQLELDLSFEVEVKVAEDQIEVNKIGKTKNAGALWGTTRALIQNMITGVNSGFEKRLELEGVGYKMAVQGKKINLNLGFSHPVNLDIPEGLEAKVDGSTLIITGIDKQQVGEMAAKIRALRPVEPYKGKGFRYSDEQVIRKEGKKTVSE